ncbi:MAG: hypothetical protein RHS_0855 [Robinsoniella sp. RHS]|nr:MAG: hypothetical protein RHS_0855 [Robinsoniella sp. RHS]
MVPDKAENGDEAANTPINIPAVNFFPLFFIFSFPFHFLASESD